MRRRAPFAAWREKLVESLATFDRYLSTWREELTESNESLAVYWEAVFACPFHPNAEAGDDVEEDWCRLCEALPSPLAVSASAMVDLCAGHHPPSWRDEAWVCARCGVPLDTRKRGLANEVRWIDAAHVEKTSTEMVAPDWRAFGAP